MDRTPINHPTIADLRAISLANGLWQVQRFDGSLPEKRVFINKKNGQQRLVPQDRWYPCGGPKAERPVWSAA